MVKFQKVSRFADIDLPLPTRATADSAGYDFVVAEDIVIPPYDFLRTKIQDDLFEKERHEDFYGFIDPLTLDDMASITKALKAKIPLVSTGMKCHLEPGQYLELSVRSSTPLKHWLIMGNSVGIIDADYCDNPDNEGEIFFQLINLSPFAIQLKRGDKIGQGIIKTYGVTDDDSATGERLGGFGSTSK
jgi:dUTP pyrophosphatase